MKAICITAEHPSVAGIGSDPKFTVGETYDVFLIDGYDSLYATIDDNCSYQFGIVDHFELLSEVRERKISSILE